MNINKEGRCVTSYSSARDLVRVSELTEQNCLGSWIIYYHVQRRQKIYIIVTLYVIYCEKYEKNI